MPSYFLRKIASSCLLILILAAGCTLNTSMAAAVEGEQLEHPHILASNNNFVDLFQHILEGIEAPEETPNLNHLKKQSRPLTEILEVSPEEAWHSVVSYLAKSDFILAAAYSYRKLVNIELLNRLKLEQSSWKSHITALGEHLEDFGKVLVSDARLGTQLHDVLKCRFQMTTFLYLKSLSQTIMDIKETDANFNKLLGGVKETVETYLVKNNLLAS
ncbi:hypothetical protein [Candidatus Odyssella thessalonicensis]|uniref:hypothetical protein n=1 Tax=Candidatus Odyssella thessalonicensis TaxID=84647 RepID=UPI000225C0C0|nr:hypothetical protein [Candidatus Odyssella thessalonicensis]